MWPRQTTWWLACATVLAMTGNAMAVELSFRQPVYRGPATPLVRDLVTIRSGDPETMRAIGDRRLDLEATENRISRAHVLEAIEPVDADVHWSGPRAIQFVATSGRIAGERLAETARAVVEEALTDVEGRTTLTVLGSPRDVAVDAADAELRGSLPRGRFPRSRFAVPVEVRSRGSVATTVPVWFALEIRRPVPVYARDLPAGTVLAPGMVSMEEKDVARLGNLLSAERMEEDTLWVTRPVNAGDALTEDVVEPAPPVRRGDRVAVTLDTGRLTIQAHGTARDHGRQGELISVLVDGATAPTRGRVIQEGEVTIVP